MPGYIVQLEEVKGNHDQEATYVSLHLVLSTLQFSNQIRTSEASVGKHTHTHTRVPRSVDATVRISLQNRAARVSEQGEQPAIWWKSIVACITQGREKATSTYPGSLPLRQVGISQ